MPAPNSSTEVKTWGETLNIPPAIVEEVRTYSALGWAVDANYKSRALTEHEMKMVALACKRTGLSLLGKQIIFLGNSLYVQKSGKVAVARKDEKFPMVKSETRPATDQERADVGIVNNDPKDVKKFEHLWVGEIHALVNGQLVCVSKTFGHACYSNINLKGKDYDTHRLCADMAATRALSRAISQFYDLFGLESYEEIIQGQPDPGNQRKIVDAEAVVVAKDEVVTPDTIIAFLKEKVPAGSPLLKKYSPARLETYTPEALLETWNIIKERVDVPEAECQPEPEAEERAEEAPPVGVS